MHHHFFRIVICCVLFPSFSLLAQNFVVEGVVEDAETHLPVIGATIRVVVPNTISRGTYSFKDGTFRLSLPRGEKCVLQISSLGYTTKQEALPEIPTGKIIVRLSPSGVQMLSTEVVAELPVEQIISRAIQKKSANLSKINTVQGEMYTKFVADTKTNIQAASSQIRNLSRVQEAFAKFYADILREKYSYIVTSARQSANISPENFLVNIRFDSFYSDIVNLSNANFISPLASGALDVYSYHLIQRSEFRDKNIYTVGFTPRRKGVPTFEGEISILEGSYDIIDINVKPSDPSSIMYLDSLRLIQKFERFQDSIWYPTYMLLQQDSKIESVKGLLGANVHITAVKTILKADFNRPIEDTIFARSIRKTEDSTVNGRDFWLQNAVVQSSEREEQLYREMDSMKIAREQFPPFPVKFNPIIGFNRITSLELGGQVLYQPTSFFAAEAGLSYNFGLQNILYNVRLSTSLPISNGENALRLTAQTSVFDNVFRISSESEKFSLPSGLEQPFLNDKLTYSLFSAVNHQDYFDYYRMQGWSVGGGIENADVKFSIDFQRALHQSLQNNALRSLRHLREDVPFTTNPNISDGWYNTLHLRLETGDYAVAPFPYETYSSKYTIGAEIGGIIGSRESDDIFGRGEIKLFYTQPTFYTGFEPMTLRLALRGGWASDNTPRQYQFTWIQRLPVLTRYDQFYTIPFTTFGGLRYVSAHVDFNASDLWWRALNLPTFEGRGLELIALGGVGIIPVSAQNAYVATNDMYAELGFGVGKIPLFFTNSLFLRAECVWGVGAIANGAFRFNFRFSSPF